MSAIRGLRDLRVYQDAMAAATQIFRWSRTLPAEERFALLTQSRRSSRSVCTNLAEAWRKRRYPASFVAKLSDAQAEASETRVHLEIAVRCGYIERLHAARLDAEYHRILGQLERMAQAPEKWTPRPGRAQRRPAGPNRSPLPPAAAKTEATRREPSSPREPRFRTAAKEAVAPRSKPRREPPSSAEEDRCV